MSCRSKPLGLSTVAKKQKQKKKLLLFWTPLTFIVWTKSHKTFFKIHLFEKSHICLKRLKGE